MHYVLFNENNDRVFWHFSQKKLSDFEWRHYGDTGIATQKFIR